VAEWLNAAVLKFARQYSHLIQINNLTAHGTTSKWAVLGGLGERFVQQRLLLLLVGIDYKTLDFKFPIARTDQPLGQFSSYPLSTIAVAGLRHSYLSQA